MVVNFRDPYLLIVNTFKRLITRKALSRILAVIGIKKFFEKHGKKSRANRMDFR
jgi:hypothetical protein